MAGLRKLKEAAKSLAQQECAQFATDLVVARSMWRAYRSFVEAKTFPEPFRAASIAENGGDPQTETGYLEQWDMVNSPDFERRMLERAQRFLEITEGAK